MSTKDLIKKIKKIEIKTRGLSNHIFSGEYHTAFKGKGMIFSEVKDYIFGDDIRDIDSSKCSLEDIFRGINPGDID